MDAMTAITGSEEQLDLRACAFVSDAEIDACFEQSYLAYLEGQRYDAAKQLQTLWRQLSAIDTVKRLPGWQSELANVEGYVRDEIRYYVGRLQACSRRLGRRINA